MPVVAADSEVRVVVMVVTAALVASAVAAVAAEKEAMIPFA